MPDDNSGAPTFGLASAPGEDNTNFAPAPGANYDPTNPAAGRSPEYLAAKDDRVNRQQADFQWMRKFQRSR